MDRRLSVSKSSSSSKIAKSSSSSSLLRRLGAVSLPSSTSSSSRPPPTIVNADLKNFRHVVQQLTGTPPPSASPSPVRDFSKPPSRLRRIAPPPLRPARPRNHHFSHQHQQPQHQAPRHEAQYNQYREQDMFDSSGRPSPHWRHLSVNFPALSPHLISPLTPKGNTWLTPTPPITSCALVTLPSPLMSPLFPTRPQRLASYGEREVIGPFSPSGRLYLHSSSPGAACAEAFNASNFSSSHELSPSTKQFLHNSPKPYGLPNSPHGGLLISPQALPPHIPPYPYPHPLPPLPSPAAARPPFSPYPAYFSPSTSSFPWLPPWPPSPFLSPLPLSPGLFPSSPAGLRPFAGSSTGFSFQHAKYE